MRHQEKPRGQSIVEMALILPLLLVVLFGIIEFGWLIFAYSTISQATRNGAEVAAQLPPYQSWIDMANNPPDDYPGRDRDDCYFAVLNAINSDLTIIGAGVNNQRNINEFVTISYPRAPIRATLTTGARLRCGSSIRSMALRRSIA